MLLPQTAFSEARTLRETRPLVLIVDAHRLCRESLAAAVIESSTGLHVRTAAADLRVILSCLQTEQSAVVLLSCCSEALRPVPLLASIRARKPAVRFVLLADPKTAPLAAWARHVELAAVLQPTGEISAVLQAIAVAAATAPPNRLPRLRPLTPREAEVVGYVAEGLSNAEISDAIGIAEKTVKVNLTNIYGKLGIHCRTDLAALAPRLLSLTGSRQRLSA